MRNFDILPQLTQLPLIQRSAKLFVSLNPTTDAISLQFDLSS